MQLSKKLIRERLAEIKKRSSAVINLQCVYSPETAETISQIRADCRFLVEYIEKNLK